jgi:hypothetical protein
MSQYALDNFGAYQKANELFDLVTRTMETLQRESQRTPGNTSSLHEDAPIYGDASFPPTLGTRHAESSDEYRVSNEMFPPLPDTHPSPPVCLSPIPS